MATELSVKELKAVLDDCELDLSMRQLSVIPVKALSKLPRATQLDFSNNKISTIPLEFCHLTQITKLDLSSNQIVHLPENFGCLVNLTHLDLYKNYIEELPLSFGELANLKWLDLKKNPLDEEYEKAAGECLDEKGCKLAAQRIVKLMREKLTEQQRLIQKQKDLDKLVEGTGRPGGENEPKEKASKKRKKKQREHGSVPLSENFANRESDVLVSSTDEEKHREGSVAKGVHAHSDRHSRFGGCVRKLLLTVLLTSVISIAVTSFLLFDNCAQRSPQWIPSSQPFCSDLRKFTTEYKVTPSLWLNLRRTVWSMGLMCTEKMYSLKEELSKSGLWNAVEEIAIAAYTKLVAFAFLLQKYILQLWGVCEEWYEQNASEFVSDLLANVWLGARIFAAMVSDFALFILEKGSMFAVVIADNIAYYVEHSDELFSSIQRIWHNLK